MRSPLGLVVVALGLALVLLPDGRVLVAGGENSHVGGGEPNYENRLAAEGMAALDFRFDFGGYRSISRETPEYSVAFEESLIRELYGKHGLEIDQIAHGGWCGRTGPRSWQDIVIAHPA